ncbi:MAG: signal peptidase I [Nitrospinae bacterium]|nr:signal peptidase I [Nitrospinota bacterium]
MDGIGRRLTRLGRDLFTATLLALLLALFSRATLVEANQVVSGSMEPTLKQGDYILVNKARYGLRLPFVDGALYNWDLPQRGDVVTFTPPATLPGAGGRLFIKRVVALPGDVITVRHGVLYVNGQRAAGPSPTSARRGEWSEILADRSPAPAGPQTVPPGTVYVVGDNRENSHDSRSWGPVPLANIEGKATLIYYPSAGLEGVGRLGAL